MTTQALLLPVADTKTYNQYENLLYSRAIATAKDYGVEVDEMVSYARTLFMEAIETYEPGKASLCTHLYNRLKKLHHLGRKLAGKNHISLQAEAGESGQTHEDLIGSRDAHDVNGPIFDYLEVHATSDEYALAVAIIEGKLDPNQGGSFHISAWAAYTRGMRSVGWSWKQTQVAWQGLFEVLTSFRKGIDHVRNQG